MSLIKGFDYEVKDLDGPKGIVTFYASSFDKQDSDGDTIVRGAYRKTIKENFKRIRHLLDHWDSVGVPISIKEDSFGLLVQSQLIMGKQLGSELFEEYKVYAELGNTMEHSVRINPIKMEEDRETNTRIMREVKLWDVSSITRWGANEDTPQGPLKGFKSIDEQIQFLEAMLKGRFQDDKLIQIENTLNSLKSLISDEPSFDTQEADKPTAIGVFWDGLNFLNDG